MRIVKRLNQRLNVHDYTTPGIACRIMDMNIVTFKKLLRGGFIPFQRATTEAGEALIRIKDIITYSIRNHQFVDFTLLDFESFKRVSGLYESVYMYAFDRNSMPSNPLLIPVTLKSLIQLIEIDPFQPICIGDNFGLQFAESIAEELNTAFPNFSANGMTYKLTLWKYGKPASSVLFSKNFTQFVQITKFVEEQNLLWKEHQSPLAYSAR